MWRTDVEGPDRGCGMTISPTDAVLDDLEHKKLRTAP